TTVAEIAEAELQQDAKRCYWCGPLAEQVHRSQRAPPCGQQLQETMCEKGFTHCAVVATSPPYLESRLCVKFYQDECYSLYCNSSKTWRMICPCQGNLCNGQNAGRETTAFATLAKLVSKNKRSKRSLMRVKGFVPLTPREVVNENNTTMLTDNETTQSAMQTDQPMEEHIELIPTTSVINDVLDEHDTKSKNIEENTIVNQDIDSEMQGDQPIEEQVIMNDAANTKDDDRNAKETTNDDHSESTKIIDEHKANSFSPTMARPEEVNNVDKLETETIPAEFVKETHAEPTDMPTLTSMIPTSIEIELSVVHIKNPKDNLPPPEALQQTVTPAKVSAPTTIGTVEISTNENQIETTTHYLKEIIKKNGETQEIKKNNDETHKIDKKNAAEPRLAHLWKLILLINLVYFLTV
ncbi:Uncharacterized protein OBRU01_24239, partial [Operophtera brumata]